MRVKQFRLMLTVTVLLTSLFGTALAGDFVQVEHPTSFRGLEWGTPLEAAPDLMAVKGVENTYFKTNERLSFGDATIISVAYYFRKDKLYRVGVAFKGRANHFLIKERLMRMYGRGRGVGNRYGWMWPDFSVEVTFDDDSKTGGLFYTYEGSFE